MKSEKEFLALLKAGLWGSEPDVSMFGKDTDWDMVYQLTKEQTVVGIVTDGAKTPRSKSFTGGVTIQF